MALDKNSLFTAAAGYIYIAPVGTTATPLVPPTPAQIAGFTEAAGLPAPWVNLGHTSRDDLPEPGFDGGDTETQGTWQNQAVKEVVTAAPVDYMTFSLQQFDDQALQLYYGQANAADAEAGEYIVENSATAAIERALCMVIVDGDHKIAFFAPKASIRRDDSIAFAVDSFSTLPVRATFLKDDTTNELFRWISLDMGINSDTGV
jgi:hypothetical protein